ncbi:cyclin-like protein, partial [Piedraia hortae CBS 480.64]
RYPQKSPRSVLDDAEEQWRFTEAELAQAPSIRDGMRQVDELDTRAKCVQFIIQAGIIAQLPVSTITTATTFFHRFLMRKSLKRRVNGERALSPYEIGATALFLATKVEESCRKLQVLASAFFCAAHQNMEITYDDQSHDWWHWAECVLDNEDALLETLCFDLLIGSPHNQLQAMMEACGIERDRDLRHAACAFYAGTVKTPLCLLLGSHTIAAAGLYAACLHCEKSLPDKDGHPWWQPHRVDIKTLRWAVKYMCDVYHAAPHRLKG